MTFYTSLGRTGHFTENVSSSPLVTGVSPKEGPPGTRIVIRGENLGKDSKDLIGLKICGVDCLLSSEWNTSSKIVVRTGPGKGRGDIIVTTRSGGQGSCTVTFRGYFVQIGPLQESAIWFDESQTVPPILGSGVPAPRVIDRDYEDPLCVSDEGHQVKYTEEDLIEMFPDASGNLSLKNFSPAWYLLKNHHSTNFDDLKSGLAYMKGRAAHRSEGPIAFMKSNLSSTLSCQSSLEEMYTKFTEDDIRGKFLNSYAVLLTRAKGCADGLFHDVLSRKDRADSTRNALNVLNRFNSLFYLPLTIERNIQKGDFNMVIDDYKRAKSRFADTQITVFKKAFAEVKSRIDIFIKELTARLLKLPNTLDEQKKILKYLHKLEREGDPAWLCIINHQRWLFSLLVDCLHEHLSLDKQNVSSKTSENAQESTGHKTPVILTRRSGPRSSLNFVSTLTSSLSGIKVSPPQIILFIEELSSIMMDHFPDLWKLGTAYFSGNLVKEVAEKKSKADIGRQTDFKDVIVELTRFYCNLVRSAILPTTLKATTEEKSKYGTWSGDMSDEVHVIWLPAGVRCIRSCLSSISRLSDLPAESSEALNELSYDIRVSCVKTTLKRAIKDIQLLHVQETWTIESNDDFGGTSQLPMLFENIINEAMQHLHEVVTRVQAEEPEIFSQSSTQLESSELCISLLKSFSGCLRKLAFSGSSYSTHTDDTLEDNLPSLDNRLMICLSNCSHVVHRVVPRLLAALEKQSYVNSDSALEVILESYRELDSELFEAYIEVKTNPIVGSLEQSMYCHNFDWNTCRAITGVRNYVKVILMGLIEIHAEVFGISPVCVVRVISSAVEVIADEVLRLIQCASEFSRHGAAQAHLELQALQDSVAAYLTDNSRSTLLEAKKLLPQLDSDEDGEVEQYLIKFQSQMSLQLMCFYSDSVIRHQSR